MPFSTETEQIKNLKTDEEFASTYFEVPRTCDLLKSIFAQQVGLQEVVVFGERFLATQVPGT